MEFVRAVLSRQFEFILYGGSIRGGKTWALLGLFVLLCRMFPGSRWAIIRETLPMIKLSVLPEFYKVCPAKFIKQKPTEHNVWTCTMTNGSQIIFMQENFDSGLKYLEKFKGLEIDGAGFEEISGISEETFDKVMERIGTWMMGKRQADKRAGKPTPPSFIAATCNPTHKWLKGRVYEKWADGTLQDNFKYIPSSVYDNPYIEEDWIESKRRSMTPLKFKMFVDGDWNINLNKKPFFLYFDREKHVTKETLTINNIFPLVLSFDFNSYPCTCVVLQYIPGYGVYFYETIQVDQGTQGIINSGKLERYRTGPYLLNIVGDRSGHSHSSQADILEGGEMNTDYLKLQNYFNVPVDEETRKQNGLHTWSRGVMSQLFWTMPVFVQESTNAPLINDFETGQVVEKTGKLFKDRNKGHGQDAGDAARYGIHHLFPKGSSDINLAAHQIIR